MSESMSENDTQRRRTCMHPLSSAQLSSGAIPSRTISAASTASQVDRQPAARLGVRTVTRALRASTCIHLPQAQAGQQLR